MGINSIRFLHTCFIFEVKKQGKTQFRDSSSFTTDGVACKLDVLIVLLALIGNFRAKKTHTGQEGENI